MIGRATRGLVALAIAGSAAMAGAQPAPLAPTPPMGWNSWDSYGTTVTEAQVKANADAMARDLARYGWRYVTVDIQWYQPTARGHDYQPGARLAMDANGRLLPAENKFPSAANGAGFKPLADYVHAKGLKFGIHIMRGIPRQAVAANTPILGTPYHARDVADTTNGSRWNPDMWGVDVSRPGGQAYYDALAKLYASWGVDFVKADDMGDHKLQPAEIVALRRALDRTGRAIVLSISPGPATLDSAAFFARHSQLWRISDDFWDSWRLVRKQFDYARDWAPHVGAGGGWPDADMLPFGRLRITDSAGRGSPSRLTADEQRTVMTLWSIFRSPLIMGGDLPTMDDATRALLTNPEVLAVNQRGRAPRQVLDRGGIRAWRSDAPEGGARYVALFNLDSLPRRVDLAWDELGLGAGRAAVRDLWARRASGTVDRLQVELAPHASALYRVEPAPGPAARFEWFEYAGRDSAYVAQPAGPGQFRNPILTGFYPDPSITRVGSDYYLVTSTFSYFPGIPIFHSRDLVSWTQIGNVIHRPEQLGFDTLGMSRGVFAPAIDFHAGTYWVANTCVDCGGNYLVTATNPRGPWSDPIWLPTVEGFDPSLFFDDDGKVYLVNNRAPAGGSKYEGHRAIWIQEYDPVRKEMVGESTQLVDGGVDITQKPIWIEGPHIYKIAGKYYLNMAEGGTAHDHRQVIFRGDRVRGPYTPGPVNPILTQRHLDPKRPFPVMAAGHADYVQTPAGEWWAIFLGSRPYDDDYFNTGRETFLLPVKWENGWPSFVGGMEPIRYALPRPKLPAQPTPAIPTTGNFTLRDEFDGRALAPYWLMVRTPRERWYDLSAGGLTLRARPDDIARREQPSFVGRRQQHLAATFTTAMRWTPTRAGDRAGLVAFQSDEYFYAFTVTLADGRPTLQVQRRAGPSDSVAVLASVPLPAGAGAGTPLQLRIAANGARYDFQYATAPGRWIPVLENADGKILSTRVAGGFGGNFTGVVVGMYAHSAATR